MSWCAFRTITKIQKIYLFSPLERRKIHSEARLFVLGGAAAKLVTLTTFCSENFILQFFIISLQSQKFADGKCALDP